MTTTEQNKATQQTITVLPLHHLVVKLRQHGFVIRPDDYIEILKVVETFGSRPENLDAPLLCPLIATSPEEQERFYKVFAEYQKEQEEASQQDGEDKEKMPARLVTGIWKYKLWLFLLLTLAVLLLVYVSGRQKPVLNTQAAISYQKTSGDDDTLRVGDSVVFDASAVLPSAAGDSSLQYFWNTGDGFERGEAVSTPVHLTAEGFRTIQVTIRSASYKIQDSTQRLVVHVCPAAPQVEFTGLNDAYSLNDQLLIRPEISGKFTRQYWKVNDSIISTGSDQALRYQFTRTGDYTLEFFGFLTAADDENAPCIFHRRFDKITITDNRYSVNATTSGRPLLASFNRQLNPLLYLLLLPALLIAAGGYFWWRKRKNEIGNEGEKASPKTYEGRKPPYETPFENNDLKLTEPESGFRQVYQSFRQKAEDELTAFNVPASIRQTIRTGGLPELVFSHRLRYTDYVVLIDRTLAKGLQVRLFDYLVNRLLEEEIMVERFYYTGKFENIANETAPDGMSLQRFSELYKMHTLIVMGTGQQLVFGAYPVLEKQLADTLQEWEYKAILTPLSYNDWGEKERLIAEKFILLPADLEGQLIILQAIREKSLGHQKYLASVAAFYETEPFDFGDIEDIKAYLGDEVLFQCLCATAVYHKLRWEILIEVGKAICAKYGQPEKMNFTHLLKFCRIRWIADGAFPPAVRLELLKALLPENEVAARETLLQMLRYAETYFGGDHFFEEEKEVQKVTSEFLLYANNPEKYAGYAAAQAVFKTLVDSGRLWDTPQKVYLENPGGRWTTLVQRHGHVKGLDEYFHEKKLEALKAGKKALWRNAIAAASFVLLLALLFLLKNNLPPNSFLLKNSLQKTGLTVHLQNDTSCANNSGAQAYQGMLTIGNGDGHPLNFDDQGYATATLDASERNHEGYISIYPGNDPSNGASLLVKPTTDTLKVVLSACEPIRKQNVILFYTDSAVSSGIIANMASYLHRQGYPLTVQFIEKFDLPTGVYFYGDADHRSGDTLAKLLTYRFTDLFTDTSAIKDTVLFTKRESGLVVVLNSKENIVSSQNITTLDKRLTEIWRGATNNRLITIYPPLIYYSTGGKQTFGTYRIEEVRQTNSGSYRVITRADNAYVVFFIGDVNGTSFDLAVCQNRFTNLQDAASVPPGSCGNIDNMSLYYEQDKDKAFLPLLVNNALEKSNEAKLKNMAGIQTRALTQVGKLFYNPRFGRSIPSRLPFDVAQSVPLSKATPFDRSYLQYPFSGEATRPPAQCEKTYTSLDQIKKLSGTNDVCRLSLAGQRLYSIPPELYSLPDLKWLDLRKNPIPEEEIQKFRQARPNVTVLTDQAEGKTPSTPERQLTQLRFDAKYSLTEASQQALSQILSYLQSNSKATVRVVIRSFYTRDNGQRTKGEYASLENFLRQNKYNSSQWQINIGDPQNVQQQAQQNDYNQNEEDRNLADVYGTNFSAGFLRPGTKAD